MARLFARDHGNAFPPRIEKILSMLHDGLPSQEVCVAILEAGIELLGVPKDVAFVRYCDCATGVTRHTVTIDDATASKVLPDTFNGITGRALRTGKPQLVGDVRTDPDYVLVATGTRSELAVPLLLGGACYGVLNFESPKRDAFSPAQLPWIQLLAQCAAIAERVESERGGFDNEVLREGTRTTSSVYLQDLDQTLDQIIAALGADQSLMAEAMMIVPHSQQVVTIRLRPNSSIAMHIRLRAGEGVAGRALQIGQPFAGVTELDNPEKPGRPIGEATHLHNTRSALAVPLRAQDGSIIGLLNVESPRTDALGPNALETLNRSDLLTRLARQLEPLQRETLTPETVIDDVLTAFEQQIAFALDPEDLPGTYYQILQVAAHVVSAPEVSGGLILVRDEAQSLVSVTSSSRENDYWAVRTARLGIYNSDLEWRLRDTSITRRVVETGKTANVGDVAKDPDYLDSRTGYKESSELVVALPHDHFAIGVFALVSPKIGAFSKTDQRAVERVARIAAMAISRAEDILSARRGREQLDAASELLGVLHSLFPAESARLREVDIEAIRARTSARILELATSKTGSEYGAIVLAEKTESGSTPRLAMKGEISSTHVSSAKRRWLDTDGVLGYAYQERRIIDITEAMAATAGTDFAPLFEEAHSELVVPMIRGDSIVGILDIESSRPIRFTTAQIQWVTFLAEQAAFALAAIDLVITSKIELAFSDLSQRIDQALITMRTLNAAECRKLRNSLLREVLTRTCNLTGSAVGRVSVAMNVYPFSEALPNDEPDLENGQFLRMVSTEPEEERPGAEGRYFAATQGVASLVLRERRLVFFNDDDSRPKEFFTNTAKTIRSGMFIPILEGARVAGVLDIESEQEDAFTDEGIAAGQRASELASKLLANTRLHLRALERQLLRTLETRILLNRSSDVSRFMDEALGYAAQLADFRTGWGTIVDARLSADGSIWEMDRTYSMSFTDGTKGQLQLIEGDHSAITYDAFLQALDTQAPVLLLDTHTQQTSSQRAEMPWPEARSLTCVPLLQPVDDGEAGVSNTPGTGPVAPSVEPVGVLAVASPRPAEFSEADKESLTLFAQTIVNGLKSVALLAERANLMREVRHDFLRTFPALRVYMDELEEPLEAALALATTVPEVRSDEGTITELIETIRELTSRSNSLAFLVAELMNWFFDLSNDQLEPETDLATVISASDIIKLLRTPIAVLASRYNRSVSWQIPTTPISIIGGDHRERLIRAVLFKFLDNAIKYAEEDVVTVTLSDDQNFAMFAVQSVGQPVPAAERERIFQLYYRGSNANSSESGSGLGLFQAKRIAEALDGHVGYEAIPPRYNVLTLSVPLAGRTMFVQPRSS